jgi:hypothetical protein
MTPANRKREHRSDKGWRPALASLRCARPLDGQRTEQQEQHIQLCCGLMSWQPAPGFGEPSFALRGSSFVNGPSSLERGSAATRTVVRSISLVARPDELTHISRINRR